jgi:hypothetical protein
MGRFRDAATAAVFGRGFEAELAGRGLDWLDREIRSAAEAEHIERVRLRPGETYTVTAYPKDSRHQRRLADRADLLTARERRLGRPSRRQLRTARKLSRAQRRLDRRTPGTARHSRAAAREATLGRRFDTVMTPSRRLARTRAELAEAEGLLEVSRREGFEAARRSSRPRRARRVYR